MGKLTTTASAAPSRPAAALVKPGTGALLLMLETVTPDTAVAVMSKFGTVVKTSLSRDAGQELQEARHTGSGGSGS